ncbi:MAG: glycosyltransferase family 4 protein [Planctomycetota bacterium]
MVKRRRLLSLVSTTRRTSPIRLILDILSGLPPDEYEICVATLSSDPEDNLRDEFLARGFRCLSLGLDGARRWLPLRCVRDLVRRENPDILYTMGIRPDLFGGAAGLAHGVPARVQTLCNVPYDDYRNLYGRGVGSLAWAAHRRALRRCFHRVVLLATRMSEQMRFQGIPEERIQVILSGGDFRGFTPPSEEQRRAARERLFGGDDPGLVAAFVGELHRPKGVFDLLHAAAEVERQGVGVTWLLIGKATETEELKRLAGALGILPRLRFPGVLEDVPGALAAADMFVHASHTEGLSRALLEGMAMGLPPVVTDISGSRDVITDPTYGIVVPPEDPAGFAKGVVELAASADLRAKMGRRGRERIESHFTAKRMAGEYHDLFSTLLVGKGSA